MIVPPQPTHPPTHPTQTKQLANTINGLSKLGAHPGGPFIEVGR